MKNQFSNNAQINNYQKGNRKTYDLEERTARFAEKIIRLCKKIKLTPYNSRIIGQLIGAAGSVGANYCEATEAESKKDFIHKIGICKKEVKESRHWLRLLLYTNPEYSDEIKDCKNESQELLLIFSAIIKSSRNPSI